MVEAGFLARIDVFAALSPEQREAVASHMSERLYQRGATIFREGDEGEAACFVREGAVKVYRLAANGQEQILGLFGPGQPFGLVAVAGGRTYPATAEAAEDCRVWLLRREAMERLMASYPTLATAVLREVGSRLRQAQDRVHSLSVRSVRQRLAAYLLERAPSEAGVVTVRLSMTHQELGAYLGASRETITRAIAQLKRQGAVRSETADLLMVDLTLLQRELDG